MRKAYVRVVETFVGGLEQPIEVIAGIELHPVNTLRSQYDLLRKVIRTALHPSGLRNWSDEVINAQVEIGIVSTFGEQRSYFIEVGRGDLDEYVQVYLP